MSRRMYIEETVDVEVEINVNTVIDFITDYATNQDLEKIKKSLSLSYYDYNYEQEPPKTLYDVMKGALVQEALEKYTLEELQKRLGIV